MTDNMIRIVWNSGEMEVAAGVIAFAALAKLRKLIFPHLGSCSAEDKQLLISCITAEYRDAVRSRKTKNAENLYTRLSEFCNACGVDPPEDLPAVQAKPDYNYKINTSKLAKIDTIAPPTENVEHCAVPIIRTDKNTKQAECFAADGFGAVIDGLPCYAQKVKSNLYILNICGLSAPNIQWRTIAAVREGLTAAARDIIAKYPENVETARGYLTAFMPDIPEYIPADPTPAPEPIPEPQPEPADPTPEQPAPERRRARRRKNPDWIGKTLTAWERRPKDPQPQPEPAAPTKPARPDWIGRKMVITIGERSARPAG